MEQLREEMDEMKEQMGHLMLEMRELVHNQGALKEENSQLKTQVSLVMEVLKKVLRKEGDVVPTAATEVVDPFSSVGSFPTHGIPQEVPPQLHVPLPPCQSVLQGGQMCGKKPKIPQRILNPIPMPYAQLLPRLLELQLIELRELATPEKLPPTFDANARCEFHSGAPGHDIENCRALKQQIQDLIDSKVILFTPEGMFVRGNGVPTAVEEKVDSYFYVRSTSNQKHNAPSWVPGFPPHQSPFVSQPNQKRKTPEQNGYWNHCHQQGPQMPRRPPRRIDPIPMTYSQLLSHLLKDSLVQLREFKPPPIPIPQGYDLNARCEYHSGTSGHSTEDCNILKHKVQDLIDSKVMSFTPNGLRIKRRVHA
ncbi:uncharacterized protein LOC131631841 [Vicia villosa]|uniref:uncharacterized protein LOC131631841 n=1 Tax=Vicia villosa TaxID=3911 RepID=UPI00273B82F6|nr:uncharacterized protein LOC131631841 [Vicia villosa]XP_058758596.1 uncharacterized protein LOC131631841 [Vicia villosa]